jgi:hypothetical protein
MAGGLSAEEPRRPCRTAQPLGGPCPAAAQVRHAGDAFHGVLKSLGVDRYDSTKPFFQRARGIEASVRQP